MEKLLPQNIEAERGVLGSVLIDAEALVQVSEQLSPRDFYRDAHSTIYAAMLTLYSQHEPADFITLCDVLERKGQLEGVGGASYLVSLLNEIPTSGNADYYARIVKRTAQHRRLIHAAGQIAALGYEQAENAVQKAEQLIYSIDTEMSTARFLSMQEVMLPYMDKLEALHERRETLTGVPTGYSDLDDLTGGFQKSDLIILAGRPAMGKTALGVSIAYNTAKRYHKKVAIYSLEMGHEQLGSRLLAMKNGVDTQRQRAGWIGDDEWDDIITDCGMLAELPVWINDTAGNPVLSMRSQLRKLIADVGSIDLVVVDFLQLIEPEEAASHRQENRVQEISKIARGLKALAREFNVPVLALAQLSRSVEARQNKHPMLSDLKESGTIEEAADMVLFLYREDYYAEQEKRKDYKPTNIAELDIAKHRNGPTGNVCLYFEKERTLFYTLSAEGGKA